jgi:indoleamine 2,3-dioxygenase
LPPVATYAGLCLWNWKPLFLSDSLALENLAMLTTFTGSLDEQWFYMISVAMEAKGGPSIASMLRAIQAAREDNAEIVTSCLMSLAQTLDELGTLLVRMYDSCDPHVFYHRIRPFLAGSKNMKEAGLPHGVYYDDGHPRTSSWRQYGGGSNAQSSLFQFFDVVLGVEHRPTGTKQDDTTSESEAEAGAVPKPRHNFIHEMRQYMPGPHRRFLQAVESVSNIREFVELNRANRQLTIAYDACLAMLRALRDKHIQMVSRYIIVKSRESRSMSRHGRRESSSDQAIPARGGTGIASINYSSPHDGAAVTAQNQRKKKMRGTGGTALIPFLKQARDETGEPAIDAWARKLLMGGRRTEADAEIAFEDRITRAENLDSDEALIVGMAGAWDLEDSGGGLCAY